MNWMKRDSPLRSSLRRKYSFSFPPKLPEGACLEVFVMHWQQAFTIIEKKNGHWQQVLPTADDVTGVINHLDQMITLLLQEAQQLTTCQSNGVPHSNMEPTGPILSFLLMEGCLDKLLSWSIHTGEFVNILKLEQLKFYEVLVTNCHQDLLFHEPVVRPLLRLLASCGDCAPVEVEKRLIILLNTLCVCLTQFPDLLQVFFGASSDHGSTRSEKRDMFLIFSLLIPFVHREGAIGQQARDALLLCMALSRKNENIGLYIAEHSNFCPVLATGLSGLYSLLPRKLPVVSEDWHQFTAEDIGEMPELAMFLNSLEFCNAVIQVAHPMVQEQLMEYLYQGFLVPVLGPALHQEAVAVPVDRLENTSKYLNTVEEIVTTTAYLELFLRTITEPILLQMFLKFILTSCYDGHRVLNSLVDRLGAQTRLCLVTMALFRTLLDLNCEDVLFELVFRYLIPCSHVMVSQRSRVRDLDVYCHSADKFLSLIPASSVLHSGGSTLTSSQSSPMPIFNPNFNSMPHGYRGGSLRIKQHQRSPSTSSFAFGEFERSHAFASVSPLEVRPSGYMDYLREAHRNVKGCTLACRNWSASYNGLDPPPDALDSSYQSKENELFNRNSFTSIERLKQPATVNRTVTHSAPVVHLHQKDSDDSILELSTANLAVHEDKLKQTDAGSCDVGKPSDRQHDVHATSKKGFVQQQHLLKTVNECDGSVLELSSANLAAHQDSLKTHSDRTLNNSSEKQHNVINNQEEILTSDIFSQIISTDDERTFWKLVCSAETHVDDSDDSLDVINGFLNDAEDSDNAKNGKQICCGEVTKDESNADSGVFESRESCTSDRDTDALTLNCAKSSDHKDSLFITIPHCPIKSDLKLSSASASSETTSTKSSNSPASPGSWESFGMPNIGQFLSILLTRLEMMMQNDVYTNLHLTGLISRLACYPQPLLRSFLLNPSLVFQPTVRSLLQVLGSLKHKVDSYCYTVDNYEDLVNRSKQFLLAREERLLLAATPRVYSNSISRIHSGTASQIQRGEPRRRSLTSLLFRRNTLMKHKDHHLAKEPTLESISDGHGYRYVSKPNPYSLEGEMESVKAKNAVLCAVVLEEFLKELAAIAQEHSIIQLNPEFWDERGGSWQ